MSGEFGSYTNGYLHSQMECAADDLASGSQKTTRAWADLVVEIAKVSRAICWSEAGDSSESEAILKSIERLPAIRRCVDNLDSHFDTYKRVAEDAIKNHNS